MHIRVKSATVPPPVYLSRTEEMHGLRQENIIRSFWSQHGATTVLHSETARGQALPQFGIQSLPSRYVLGTSRTKAHLVPREDHVVEAKQIRQDRVLVARRTRRKAVQTGQAGQAGFHVTSIQGGKKIGLKETKHPKTM